MEPDFFTLPPAPTPRVWSVSALTRAVADALEAHFNPVRVRGEVTGFTCAASGHCYFALKDAAGQLRCVLFARTASGLGFAPRDGDQVEARGRLSVYAGRGALQLVVDGMERAGQGALFEEFLRLKARLDAEGLFDAAHKRALPAQPRGIGIVTSLQAAALHDVVTTLTRRVPHIPLLIAPAAVQGPAAPTELCAALRRLYAVARGDGARTDRAAPVDVILLVRGGGAIEDLWAFNDERLARVIAASPVPVVSGVGHETDFTISDFVADVRAPTPTAAAELASAPRVQISAALDEQARRLQRALRARLDSEGQRLDWLAGRVARPSAIVAAERLRLAHASARLRQVGAVTVAHERARLDHLEIRAGQGLAARAGALRASLELGAERLARARGATLDAARQRLERAARGLTLLDPQLVLQRGYAWLEDADGMPLTRAAEARVGSELGAVLADGRLDVTVIGRHPR